MVLGAISEHIVRGISWHLCPEIDLRIYMGDPSPDPGVKCSVFHGWIQNAQTCPLEILCIYVYIYIYMYI